MASCPQFRAFLKQRKREYAAKFPFLTDCQITAKLKRIWNASQDGANNSLSLSIGKTSVQKRKRTQTLATNHSKAIKENICTSSSKDIPACSWTRDQEFRCDPPQTTCTPHTCHTYTPSPLIDSVCSGVLLDITGQSPASASSTFEPEECFSNDRSLSQVSDRSSTKSKTRRRLVRRRKEELGSSQPKQREQSLLESSIDTSTSSLPPTVSSYSSRLTRGQSALLTQYGIPTEPSALEHPPTKRKKTCDIDERPEASQKTPDEHLGVSILCEQGSTVKSSSPSEGSAGCTTTLSQLSAITEQRKTPVSPGQQDLLCDMFLPLTTEKQSNPVPPHYSNSIREEHRPFLSAMSAKNGQREWSNYCMFDDASDIFM